MESTCNFKECALAKKWKIKKPEECFNYIENQFQTTDGKVIIVKDCCPKRSLLMIQELYNSVERLHISNSELKNQVQAVNKMAAAMIDTAVKKLNLPRDKKILIGGDS